MDNCLRLASFLFGMDLVGLLVGSSRFQVVYHFVTYFLILSKTSMIMVGVKRIKNNPIC